MPRTGTMPVSFVTALLHLPYDILLVYIMIYGLIPLLLQGKYRRFLGWLSVFLLFCLVSHFLFRALVLIPFRTGKPTPIVNGGLNTSYLTIFTTGGFINQQAIIWTATGIKLLRCWYQKERNVQQLAYETLTVELDMLKAQIHPHFLFNTLNNLYSLTLRQSSRAPDMVLKLSGLLHYMLHECTGSTVTLMQEIAFLEGYIELEKLRYGDRLIITTTVEGDIEGKTIAPLLLIPFLENAFKHGASRQIDQARIDLRLQVEGHELTFYLENTTNPVTAQTHQMMLDRSGHSKAGIGLPNVKKRLQLIYPNAHHIHTELDGEHFVVALTLVLADLPPVSQYPQIRQANG